jgi:hypothetical protein
MAQANVEVKVQSQDLDKLRGKLVELQKGLKIQYDIDGKPIDVVIDKSLNLQKQVRLLTAELRKTKEGTAEFQLLSSRLGEAQDNLAKTTAKSRDLLSSLQLLPGPVGNFFSQLNGAIGLLKTFSSFSLKDLQFQFKETVDDIKDIVKNFAGIKDSSQSLGELEKTANNSSTAISNATSNVLGLSKATETVTKSNQELINTIKGSNKVVDIQADGTKKLVDGSDNVVNAQKRENQSYAQGTALKNQNTASTNSNTASTEVNTVATNANSAAQKGAAVSSGLLATGLRAVGLSALAATSAVATLDAVIAATGIGLLVILISSIVYKLYEWATATEDVEGKVKDLTDAIEAQSRALQRTIEDINFATKRAELLAKIQGKSAQEITDITIQGLKNVEKAQTEHLDRLLSERTLAAQKQGKYQNESDEVRFGKITELNKEIEKAEKDLRQTTESIQLQGLENELRIAEQGRKKVEENNNKKLQKNKEYLQKLEQDTKTGLEKLRSLEEQNALLIIEDERKRTAKELEFQKKREEDEIKALKLKETEINGVKVSGEQLRAKLLEEVRVKYGQITLNNSKKYAEDDLKILKDFQRKTRDIEIEGTEDKRQREDLKREEDLRRQLEDLEEDKTFIKLSEEEKEKIRQFVRQKYAVENRQIEKDRAKEDKDERLKKLDDELRFLQIRGEAIREGTKAFFDNQRAILDAAEKRELEAVEDNEKEKTAIKEKYVKLRKDLDQQEKLSTLNAIGETIGAFANLTSAIASSYDEEAKTSKEAFEQRKKLQVATAVMSAASGIIQILAQPSTLPSPFDFIVKGINAAALAVSTAVQISNIKRTQFEGGGGAGTAGTVRGMARGGYIDGARHAEGGVLIEAEGGEAVMTRGAVSMFGPLLAMMNQAGGGTNFNKDMMFTANDAPSTSPSGQSPEPVVMKTYVVSNELTTEAEKQARLKNLSTL